VILPARGVIVAVGINADSVLDIVVEVGVSVLDGVDVAVQAGGNARDDCLPIG
jgi:hypothetical protein